jgi:enamine deaminase RidA (YjgF/YER057c/UK114 family)
VDGVELFIYVVSTDPTQLARVWHRFADSAIGRAFTTASTPLGVAALGYADQLVELELTAVRSGGPGVGAGER